MHHVMNLPATIAVESISCANLTIRVPWRHFKSEPMSVVMEQVVVQMAELPTAGPPDKTLPGFDKIVQMLFVASHIALRAFLLIICSFTFYFCTNAGALVVEPSRLLRKKRSFKGSLRILVCRSLIFV